MWNRISSRAFQAAMHGAAKALPWRRAEIRRGVECLPELIEEAGMERPFVVTGPHLYRKGIAERALQPLRAAGKRCEIFFAVEADPSVETVEEILRAYLKTGCDGIIAIGGGSPMDAAKAAAARIARPEKTLKQMTGLMRVRRKIPPLIAVPTTAGTGSETTIAAVISEEGTHRKAAVSDLCLIPRFAVLDAELTLGLPPSATAQTGMDALTHAIEAYLCVFCNSRENREIAASAARSIFHNLERAVANGEDREARKALLEASYWAGCAFTRAGVGNVHALAHAVGGKYGVAHGLANAVFLPLVLEDYGEKVYKDLSRLAEAVGISAQGEKSAAARALTGEIQAMNRRMGIPERLDCIRQEDIPQMAEWAAREANPIYSTPVFYDQSRFMRILRRAQG